MHKHFNLEAMRKDIHKMNQQIIQTEKEITDEEMRESNEFNLSTITLYFGLSIDDVRAILLEKLPENDSRRNEIWANMQADNMSQRLAYPGGYDAFVTDVNNHYFPTITPDMLSQ